MMKKFFYILMALPLFLVSCSKEEEENAIDPTIFNKNISVGESCTINEVGSISLETPNDFIATINGNKITGNHFRVINFLLQYRQRQIQTLRNSFPHYDIICRFGAIPRNV